MLFVFLFLKLILTLFAVWLISIQSYFLLLVFLLFFILDILDGKIMGKSYRKYDTLSDRVFAYSNFLVFLFMNNPAYPSVIYMASFLIRDLMILIKIQKVKNLTIKSNFFDRALMLGVATFFALEASGIIPTIGVSIEIASLLIALVIILQGLNKAKRISLNLVK